MLQLPNVVRDRGSRYAVSGGRVTDLDGVAEFLRDLQRDKKFARATHHSWAVVLTKDGPQKNDDGESGAGAVILRMLEREGLCDTLVVVTRWYGGVNLGGDRFSHIVTCTRTFLAAWSSNHA